MNRKWLLGYLLLAIQFYFLGCTKICTTCTKTEDTVLRSVGLKIPADKEATSLSELLKKPEDYHQKKVLLEGVFAGACLSLCKFTYREGKDVITVYPRDFKLPKIKKGQRIRVYAEVTAGKRMVISALGLEEVEK